MIQTLTIPKLQSFCAVVQQCFPRAHIAIAGGAPRDLLNRRPVKDIDVFIQLTGEADPEDRFEDCEWARDWFDGCEALSQRLYCPWKGMGGSQAHVMNAQGYSYGAFTLVDYPTGLHMHPVQLVFIDENPVENIGQHFDFGLSQVWVTPNQLRMTPAYWHDHFGQRITYLQSAEPNEQRRTSSIHRLARLRAKYAGWRFDRCGGLVMPVDAPGSLPTPSAPPAPFKPYDWTSL